MAKIFRSRSRAHALSVCMLVALFGASGVSANPISLVSGSINMFRDIRAANDVGIGQGDVFQFGADIVGGSTGTTLRGLYTQAPTFTQSAVANCQPLTVDQNFCARTVSTTNVLGANPQRLSPWTFEFRNGTDFLSVAGPSLAGAGDTVPFPVDVTISGSGPTPTISWTIPNAFVPNGFRVQIFDRNDILANGQANVIQSANLVPTASSYTFAPGILQTGGKYTINLQVIETRLNEATPDPNDRLPFNGNPSILVRSNSFFDFSQLDPNAPPNINLPTIVNGVYNFNVSNVGPSSVTFIDPLLAIGYQYAKGAGDPNFASVLLPTGIGDNLFDLFLWDGSAFVDSGVDINGGVQYFFATGGVDRFEILGIETSANLDPANATAFVTGLTFVSAGQFTGTMTPVTIDVPVPEPGTLALVGLGLAGIAAWRRRRLN